MTRRRWNVGAVKIPYAQRDVAHAVITDGDPHGYRDILGSDTPDVHERHPVGAPVAYTVELTDEEADQFRSASNCRYVELDGEATADRAVGRPTGTDPIPSLSTLAYMRARYVPLTRWHGRDIPAAILDEGTTQAVRDAMGWRLVARAIHSGITMPPGREIYSDDHDHGCLVAPNGVPAGGMLLDGIITGTTAGSAAYSAMATGITWAVDNAAKVINISYSASNSGGSADNLSQALLDAVNYAATAGVQIVFSAGNDSAADLNYPASICRTHANVHSSVAFDEATDRRGLFSNHHANASGCAPGVYVDSLAIDGTPLTWNGTSASAPHMTQLIARGASGGTYTAAAVAAALRANTRDTGAGASEQGAGAWDLHRALAALGGASASGSGDGLGTVSVVSAVGGAGLNSSYTVDTPAGIAVDDVRVAVLVASLGARLRVSSLPGWRVLLDEHYEGLYELAAGQSVGPTRVQVLAKPYTPDEPDQTVFHIQGPWFSAFTVVTLRAPGGLDPEKFVPIARFGTSASVTTVPVLPVTTDDLLLEVFAQRHPTAPTATLPTPAGLTSLGFWQPATGSTGYPLRVASLQLASGARTSAYTSTSNSATGTWCAVALTVPPTLAATPTVVQTEPAGPVGAPALLALLRNTTPPGEPVPDPGEEPAVDPFTALFESAF